MASLTFTYRRPNPETPWLNWFKPYAEELFTEEEIAEFIQPTRDAILALPGYKGVAITALDSVALEVALEFDTQEQVSECLEVINGFRDRVTFLKNKREALGIENLVVITGV